MANIQYYDVILKPVVTEKSMELMGFKLGSIIRKKQICSPAPSTLAASIIPWDIPIMPASQRITVYPKFFQT